jgi:signal transduction histidine kinase
MKRLRELLRPAVPDPAEQMFRLKAVERDVILPIKALYLGILVYFFYFSRWYSETGTAQEIAQVTVERFFVIYLVINAVVAAFILLPRRMDLARAQRVVFAVSFVDALFLSALTLVTGGFDSILYWLFPGLIIRNAVSHPVARPQIILNLSVVLSFVIAGVLDIVASTSDLLTPAEPSENAEPLFLRFVVLLLFTGVCYGLQVLIENARQAAEESREFASRQDQLRAAGRLAAEIAHQIKNPLGIINNAAWSIQRAAAAGRPVPADQLGIIREEVARSDKIITELMGYAQLAEGTVERLNVVQELNHAINQVLPPGVYRNIQVRTSFGSDIPPLLMQRRHFSEIISNLLQNAREALPGGGVVDITAEAREDAVRIVVADDGPGVAADQCERIFEPYVSTKPQGTGLGLSIVRHNAEVYGGHARVESELGRGARFIIDLPTRTFMRLRK